MARRRKDKQARAPPAGLLVQCRPEQKQMGPRLGKTGWDRAGGGGGPTCPIYLVKLNCRNRDLHGPRGCCQEHLRDTTCIGKQGRCSFTCSGGALDIGDVIYTSDWGASNT